MGSLAATFMGVPGSMTAAEAGVVVLGAPFDCGPSVYRFGPHLAPAAIRAASQRVLSSRIDSDRDVLTDLDVRDGGDVAVSLDDVDRSLAAIQIAVAEVLSAGAVPLVLGGDGSVALAIMRALGAHAGECAVLHFDAHTDCNPPGSGRNEAASAFWRASAEGVVATGASVHLGLRGPTLMPNTRRVAQEMGYQTLSMDEILDRGPAAVVGELRRIIGERPVYVCWDMDVFDPSVAPGVFSPSCGGLTAAQGLRLVHGLSGLRIVAVDINTVSPPHDIDELTALLAAQLAFELLHALPPPPETE